jgi:uncharacterized protein (AIM24 family)
MADAPADWYPDPLGRHEYRYWDGAQWTEHVADAGEASVDPIAAAAPAASDTQVPVTPGASAEVVEPGESSSSDPEPSSAATVPPVGSQPSPTPGTVSGSGRGGIRGSLVDGSYAETDTGERVKLQNAKMLKVELGSEVLARQGSMVAFQGAVDFDYEGSGGVGRFLKKAMTGEGVPLMRCRGQGEVFLAHDADEVHLLWLDGGGITVNGSNILAFDPSLSWDIERISGAGVLAGGMFNTVLRGSGWVAITSHGTPLVLDTDAPTFADTDAAVAWSSSLRTSLNRTFKASSLIGRGSGEVAQLAFAGQGFVIVQASEGPTVPPHSHGSS